MQRKIQGKKQARNTFSDLYPLQFQCGKAHVILLGSRSKKRRTLEKDRIGRTQTISRRGERRRIDEKNTNSKKMDVVWKALTSI